MPQRGLTTYTVVGQATAACRSTWSLISAPWAERAIARGSHATLTGGENDASRGGRQAPRQTTIAARLRPATARPRRGPPRVWLAGPHDASQRIGRQRAAQETALAEWNSQPERMKLRAGFVQPGSVLARGMYHRQSQRMLLLATLLAVEAAPPQATAKAMLLETTSVVAWPLQLELPEFIALAAATPPILILMHHDRVLYGDVARLPSSVRHHSLIPAGLLLGNGVSDAVIAGTFALGGDRARRTSIEGLQALVGVAVTSTVMKHVFREARPESDAGRKSWFGAFSADSFPSGHAMSAFALATVISMNYPWAAPIAYPAAGYVGFSVIKRGWHWPSDVLVGTTMGIVIARVSVRIHEASVGPGSLQVRF